MARPAVANPLSRVRSKRRSASHSGTSQLIIFVTFGMLPMERFRRGDFHWREYRGRLFEGFHRSLVAYASAGNNLLLEHILEEPEWASDLALMFQPLTSSSWGFTVTLMNLSAGKHFGEIAGRSAADDFHRVHKGQRYDLQLRAGQTTADYTAQVIYAWTLRRSPSVFEELALESRATASRLPVAGQCFPWEV